MRLIKEFRKGSENAFEQIYDLHHLRLYYFVLKLTGNREEAEEITSETFVKLWRLHARFSRLENIKAFLYITARNSCIDYIRSAKKVAGEMVDYNYTLSEEDLSSFEQEVIEAELLEKIFKEIESLPAMCRKVVKMSFVDLLNNEEIARQLQLNLQTVKNHKSRALNRLRSAIKLMIGK
jgi:RNA polymerase sigma-70 factor (ECF subfamily)